MTKSSQDSSTNNIQDKLSNQAKMLIEGIMSTIKRYDEYRRDVIEKNSDPNKNDISQLYKMYAMTTISNEVPVLKNYFSSKSKQTLAQYIDIISDDLEEHTSKSHENEIIGINRSRRMSKSALMSSPEPNTSLNEYDKAALLRAADIVGNHILKSIKLAQKPQDIDTQSLSSQYKARVLDRLSMGVLNQEMDQLSIMLESKKIGAHQAYAYKQNILFSAIARCQNDFGDFLSGESKESLLHYVDLLHDQIKRAGAEISTNSTPKDSKSISAARLNIRKAITAESNPPYYLLPDDKLELQNRAEKAASNIIIMVTEALSQKTINTNIINQLRNKMLDQGMEFSNKSFDKINNYVSHITKNLNSEQLSAFEDTILQDMTFGIQKNQTVLSKIRHWFGDKKTEISDEKLIHISAGLKKKLYNTINEMDKLPQTNHDAHSGQHVKLLNQHSHKEQISQRVH